jgi:hypothetical protein
LWNVLNGLRRKRRGNPAGASRGQTFRHQTPVDRNGIETNLLVVRWQSQRCHWRLLPKHERNDASSPHFAAGHATGMAQSAFGKAVKNY